MAENSSEILCLQGEERGFVELAGTFYSYPAIPKEWIRELARTSEIENLANRFHGKFYQS